MAVNLPMCGRESGVGATDNSAREGVSLQCEDQEWCTKSHVQSIVWQSIGSK